MHIPYGMAVREPGRKRLCEGTKAKASERRETVEIAPPCHPSPRDGLKPLDTLNQEKGTPPSIHSFVMALQRTSKI